MIWKKNPNKEKNDFLTEEGKFWARVVKSHAPYSSCEWQWLAGYGNSDGLSYTGYSPSKKEAMLFAEGSMIEVKIDKFRKVSKPKPRLNERIITKGA